MTNGQVVVTDCDHDAFLEEEQVAAENQIAFRVEQSTPDTLVRNCQDADGVLVQYSQITAEVMDALPKLQVIARYGVGVDTVDIEAATRRGIAVCNVPDYGTEVVSDHAIALALSVARGIVPLDHGLREGRVDLPVVRPLYQVRGRVFGVVGLGRIGTTTAEKAKGLGYTVIGYDKLAQPGNEYHGIPAVSWDELLQRSQVISLHVPLDQSTRSLIGEQELRQMRSDCILINTARGGVIDTEALVRSLSEGRIAGAGIDCHDIEPLPTDHPLTTFPNVVLTPHLAWYCEESYAELKRRTMEGAVDVLCGRTPRNIINPEVLQSAQFAARRNR